MPPYTKQPWADDVAGGTPIDAAALTHMENGIDAAQMSADAAQAAADDAHIGANVTVNPAGLIVVTGNNVQAALAQLDARVGAVPAFDLTGIADGQLMEWNAALSKFVPVNQTGSSELAYAANVTGTVTAVANAANVDVPGVTFTIQPDPRPVYIQAGLAFQQTTVGDGSLILHITDTTGAVDVHAPSVRLPNTVTAGIKTAYIMTFPFRLGPIAAARTFKISAQVSGSGATPAVNVLNTATNLSWMRAFA
jgi:hypothetical protein